MVRPLQPRVSTHHWGLSASSETQSLRTDSPSGGLSAWMLSEDLDHQHYAYNLGLEYDGVEVRHGERLVSRLLKELGRYEREGASSLFPKLVSVVARDHLTYGRSIFELFEDSNDKIAGPRLGVLPGWSLKRHGRITLQATPSTGRIEWRRLTADALIEFRLPGRLGKDLYRTKKRLRALDAYRPGDPVTLTDRRFQGYDFNIHRNTFDELAARATRAIGWDGRSSFLERGTNSYRTYRQLRFRHTWLTIVTATTATLNKICELPAVNGGTPLKIRVTGLPATEDIERCMDAVKNGTQSLDDIFNSVLFPQRNQH
jgi:hypothetical protein